MSDIFPGGGGAIFSTWSYNSVFKWAIEEEGEREEVEEMNPLTQVYSFSKF